MPPGTEIVIEPGADHGTASILLGQHVIDINIPVAMIREFPACVAGRDMLASDRCVQVAIVANTGQVDKLKALEMLEVYPVLDIEDMITSMLGRLRFRPVRDAVGDAPGRTLWYPMGAMDVLMPFNGIMAYRSHGHVVLVHVHVAMASMADGTRIMPLTADIDMTTGKVITVTSGVGQAISLDKARKGYLNAPGEVIAEQRPKRASTSMGGGKGKLKVVK